MQPVRLTSWFWGIVGRLAFSRIRVVGRENVPTRGPILFVATHRNGALDAAPYAAAVPHAVPVVSAQLHRMPLGRFVFRGIAVARAKDKARGIHANNREAMEQCVEVLRSGRQLFIMPEGTSTLGPRHLPIHRGAARIARAAMDAGISPIIVPLGAHYEAATMWQSRVEVLVGNPIRPETFNEDELHELITQGLEAVGANFSDEETQRLAEKLAYASTLGSDISYARALKAFERGIPKELADAAGALEELSRAEHLRQHQNVPLMPLRPLPLCALSWVVLFPIVLLFLLLNAPALAAGYVASKKLSDAANVISFWRMAVGFPAGLGWAALCTAAAAMAAQWPFILFYWAVTIACIIAWFRFRELSVALYNGTFHASAKPTILSWQELLKDAV